MRPLARTHGGFGRRALAVPLIDAESGSPGLLRLSTPCPRCPPQSRLIYVKSPRPITCSCRGRAGWHGRSSRPATTSRGCEAGRSTSRRSSSASFEIRAPRIIRTRSSSSLPRRLWRGRLLLDLRCLNVRVMQGGDSHRFWPGQHLPKPYTLSTSKAPVQHIHRSGHQLLRRFVPGATRPHCRSR